MNAMQRVEEGRSETAHEAALTALNFISILMQFGIRRGELAKRRDQLAFKRYNRSHISSSGQ